MAELVFFRRSQELMRFGLAGQRVTVGRAASNDILIPDSAISRQQCAFEQGESGWRLLDLSGSGTEVAGKPVQDVVLSDGSDIGFGQWRAVFNLSRASGQDEPTRRLQSGDTTMQVTEEPVRPGEARLLVQGADEERTVPMPRQLVVGSGEDCDLRLTDSFVSSRHALIERCEDGFLVRDLQSLNGTFVGAVRVYEAQVPFGTSVRVGSTALTLARHEDERKDSASFEGMVGSDASMRKIFETIERVAPSQAAVSIFGESGTGKELVARAVHARSTRSGKAFIPINCSALSKELAESELFGHEKGAFTGAERLRKGAFEEADHGTLFLDEIGELTLGLQAKLLRALELGEIKRVGATRPMTVDVRIVAATNRDLRADVRQGRFREDLYWRLCVVPILMPPLRARRNDLKTLIAHFVKVYAPHGATLRLGQGTEARLLEHPWPGNIRELKHTLHRSLLLRRGENLEVSDLRFDQDHELGMKAGEASGSYDPHLEDLTRIFIVGKKLEEIDDEVFLKTCRRVGARPSFLARELGQSRGAAYRRMEKLGIRQAGGASEPNEAEDAD